MLSLFSAGQRQKRQVVTRTENLLFIQNSSQSGQLAGKFPGKWDKLSSRIETIRLLVLGQVAPSTMGNSTSGQTVRQALKDLLKVKGIRLKKGDPGELFKSSGSGLSLVLLIRTSYRAQLGEVREGLEVCRRTGSSC